jgi:hypothetical protein
MEIDFQYDVFLSHSSKDKAAVREIAEQLRKDGLKVWFDQWVLKAGDSIPAKIEEGLEQSRVLVLCMSANAFGADWVQLESQTIRFRDPLNRKRRFIPLRLDAAPIKGSLAQFLYINWLSEGQELGYAKLVEACRGSLEANDKENPYEENAHKMTPLPPANAVQPLHIAEDRFLQILLSDFALTRREGKDGPNFELSVNFNDNTNAIWDQNGKRYLRTILTQDKCDRFQAILDEFFDGDGNGVLEIEGDDEFFFRYASGGTLVTAEFEDSLKPNRYYCLFYRDVHPIGWNIANGGTDTRAELLNPHETINRELREELIIADFIKKERYVFAADKSKPFDHPAHEAARRLWKKKFPNRDLNALEAVPVDIKPVPGPDSLRVKMGRDKEIKQSGFYLNINGKDFGIEFDSVATIRNLPWHITLFDGEIDGGKLVNCPVGLFEVERFDERLRLGETSFVPDFFYFEDQRFPKEIEVGKIVQRHDSCFDLTRILETQFIEHVRPIRITKEIDELKAAIKANTHLDLCPVTRKIANRHRQRKARLAASI